MNDTVTISIDDYNRLIDDSRKLAALEAAGVDNWEGYDMAIEIYNSDEY